jgi:hypothetical protein
MMTRIRITLSAAALFCICAAGCQTVAPIHVWAPPRIDSAVGKRVVIAPIGGDPALAGPLMAAMLREIPRDHGRELVAIDARLLATDPKIQVVSNETGQTSDIALCSLARRNGIDMVLFGEVLGSDGQETPSEAVAPFDDREAIEGLKRQGIRFAEPPKATKEKGQEKTPASRTLRVSWKLIDVGKELPLNGTPVISATHPNATDDDLVRRAASDAWELLLPHVVEDEAELSNPRFGKGAKGVRHGNEAAKSGDWAEAEAVWKHTLARHPRCHAALHNLAIAAVARQNFDEAKSYISGALAQRSSSLYQSTAVWIERRQRAYHTAFGLPDPPEGWAATRPVELPNAQPLPNNILPVSRDR